MRSGGSRSFLKCTIIFARALVDSAREVTRGWDGLIREATEYLRGDGVLWDPASSARMEIIILVALPNRRALPTEKLQRRPPVLGEIGAIQPPPALKVCNNAVAGPKLPKHRRRRAARDRGRLGPIRYRLRRGVLGQNRRGTIGTGLARAQCDTSPGGSGSPVLVLENGGAKLIGIATGGMLDQP
jgi:hypothetical protein